MLAFWLLETMGNMIRRLEKEKREIGVFPQFPPFLVTPGWLYPSPAGLAVVGVPFHTALSSRLQEPLPPHTAAGLGMIRKPLYLFTPGFYNIPGDFPTPCLSAMSGSSNFLMYPHLTALFIFCLMHRRVPELLDCPLCHNPGELGWTQGSWSLTGDTPPKKLTMITM